MKQPILFFLLLCFISNVYSQKDSTSNYISLSLGGNYPVGSYAATDLQKSSSGFAKAEQYFLLNWSKLESEKIGYTISLCGQRNPVDDKAMAEEFSHVMINTGAFGASTPGVPVTEAGSYYPNWSFKQSSWLLASLQGGLYGEFPLSSLKNVKLIARLTAGAMYAKLPEQTGQSITDTSNVIIYQSKGSAIGFAYTLGTGIKYKVNKGTVFLLNINYMASSKLTFKDVSTVVTLNKGSSINQLKYTSDASQAFKSVSLSLGIGFKL